MATAGGLFGHAHEEANPLVSDRKRAIFLTEIGASEAKRHVFD